MPRLRLLRGSTGAMTEPDPAVRCQPKDAPALPPLSEHVGQRSGGSKRSFQLRSPNERCQYQLVARSQRHNERGGRRLRRRRRPEPGRKCSFSRHNPAPYSRTLPFHGRLMHKTIKSGSLGVSWPHLHALLLPMSCPWLLSLPYRSDIAVVLIWPIIS